MHHLFISFLSFTTENCWGKCYSGANNPAINDRACTHKQINILSINQSIHEDDEDIIIYAYVHGESSCQFLFFLVATQDLKLQITSLYNSAFWPPIKLQYNYQID